mmetsp:Transcript_24541/g.36020  ORF Transcript_24541/g.36020 Transcript_24541/m.36020 type:complete len:205 (+) Transcript_24541:525-1139(+)
MCFLLAFLLLGAFFLVVVAASAVLEPAFFILILFLGAASFLATFLATFLVTFLVAFSVVFLVAFLLGSAETFFLVAVRRGTLLGFFLEDLAPVAGPRPTVDDAFFFFVGLVGRVVRAFFLSEDTEEEEAPLALAFFDDEDAEEIIFRFFSFERAAFAPGVSDTVDPPTTSFFFCWSLLHRIRALRRDIVVILAEIKCRGEAFVS